jgi:hypothetical protein
MPGHSCGLSIARPMSSKPGASGPGAPDEVTTCARLLRLPPIPDIPEQLRGRSFVAVDGALIGDEAEGARLMQPLRALGPEIDSFREMPPSGLSHIHMDPEHPVSGIGEGMVLNDLTPETIQALLDVAGPERPLPLLAIDIRHAGGALLAARPEHGVAGTLEGRYLVWAVGMAVSPELRVAVAAAISTVLAALAPCDAGRRFMNLTAGPTPGAAMFGTKAHERLLRIHTRYDPDRLFQAAHEVSD